MDSLWLPKPHVASWHSALPKHGTEVALTSADHSLSTRNYIMAHIEKGQVFVPATSVEYADGSVVSREILRNNAGTLTLFAFDAGQGLSEHTAPFDATVTILDGEAEILLDGVPHRVAAGEMLIMPAGVPHALNAKVRFKMLLTMIRG